MTVEFPDVKVLLKGSENKYRPSNAEELALHFEKLGLRCDNGKWNGRFFSRLDWARFEIVEVNDLVHMLVKRKDGTITQAYIVPGYRDQSKIHLQVESKIENLDGRGWENAETSGILPFDVVSIGTGYLSHDGNYIGFYGENGGGLKITQRGLVRFEQANPSR